MFSCFQIAPSWQPCNVLSQFWLCLTKGQAVDTANMVGEKAGDMWQRLRMRRQAHDMNLSPLGSCTQTDLQLDRPAGRLWWRQTQRTGGCTEARGYRDEGWRTVKTTWTPYRPAVEWVWFFIRLYPIGVKWEKGTVWPSSFGSAITADIWICGQADWLHSKHQLKGYSWWIITSCVPGRIANCSRRTMNNNRVSCLFTKSEWHPDPLLRPFSQELQKLQSEIVNTNTFLLMYQLQLGNVWCNFYN